VHAKRFRAAAVQAKPDFVFVSTHERQSLKLENIMLSEQANLDRMKFSERTGERASSFGAKLG
jgi:hypothetical protein